MPKISVPKESLEGKKPLTPGIYDVRLDGFEPKRSREGSTINLNPVMKVINNPNGLNDNRAFCNLNTAAGWIMKDFAACFGFELEGPDKSDLPGEFVLIDPSKDGNDPSNWKYEGPLLQKTGKLEIAERIYNGKVQADIKRFFSQHPAVQCSGNLMKN